MNNFNVEYNAEFECVIATFNGKFTKDTIIEYRQEIMRITNEYDCKKFINDIRKADIDYSIGEIYFTPRKMIEGDYGRDWKRAIVVNEINDKMRFFETTSSNQGLQLKLFDNYNDALSWLGIE